MLEFRDAHYMAECLRDQNQLLVNVIIRRCVLVERKDEYPDSPLVPRYENISIKADVREVPMSEIAHSGGLLLTGDLIIWSREEIRGPTAVRDHGDPKAYADTFLINGQEYVVVGVPFTGRGVDPAVLGYTANIRRRQTGGNIVP
jgi:hypothetical protein